MRLSFREQRTEQLPNGVDQKRFVQRLTQKRVRAAFARAILSRQNAQDEDDDVVGWRIVLEGTTHAQSITLGNENLRDDNRWVKRPRKIKGPLTIGREFNGEPRLLQEISLEALYVGITLDNENQGAKPRQCPRVGRLRRSVHLFHTCGQPRHAVVPSSCMPRAQADPEGARRVPSRRDFPRAPAPGKTFQVRIYTPVFGSGTSTALPSGGSQDDGPIARDHERVLAVCG